jgi:hypothetical protein
MAAIASAELIAGLERTVRVGPARSNRMLQRVINLPSFGARFAEAG